MAKSKLVKKAHEVQTLTHLQVMEYHKCMFGHTDPATGKFECGPVYFAKNYVKIQHPTRGEVPFLLYDYQEKMMETFLNNNKVITLSARQTGKCEVGSTIIKIIAPLNRSFINSMRRCLLKLLDRDLYERIYNRKNM